MHAESPASPAAASAALHGWCPLPALGVIAAEGADAAPFLHNQLTQDFALLREHEARFAAYCTPKGRMLASFWAWRAGPERVLLVCARDVLPAMLKRLSMFVLRAKVKLRDASDEWVCRGVLGASIAALTGGQALPVATWVGVGSGFVVGIHPAAAADTLPRALWLAPVTDATPAPGREVPADTWNWAGVASGVADVGMALTEVFVPQMLNYESVGGVNFKKGCYPGQEVVARSQFRGAIKRRAMLAHADAPLALAQDVFSAQQPADQPVGVVAAVAPNPAGGWDAIVSVQTAHSGETLTAGSPTGSALSLAPVPYPLADI